MLKLRDLITSLDKNTKVRIQESKSGRIKFDSRFGGITVDQFGSYLDREVVSITAYGSTVVLRVKE